MQGEGQDHVNEVIGQAHSHLQRWRTWRSQPGQYANILLLPRHSFPFFSLSSLVIWVPELHCTWARLAGFAGKIYADYQGWPAWMAGRHGIELSRGKRASLTLTRKEDRCETVRGGRLRQHTGGGVFIPGYPFCESPHSIDRDRGIIIETQKKKPTLI